MTTLLLVRHGETEWNQDGRFQGQTDIPLNARGHEQALALAAALAAEPIVAIYASDLCRAHDTAQPLADRLKLPIVITPDLREASFGSWEGLTFAEVRALDPITAEGWLRDPVRHRPHDGETREAIVTRVMGAMRRIAEQHPDGTVAIVTHGGPVKCAVMCALEGEGTAWKQLRVDNGTVTRLVWRDGIFEVAAANLAIANHDGSDPTVAK